jgi:hypothetical protein
MGMSNPLRKSALRKRSEGRPDHDKVAGQFREVLRFSRGELPDGIYSPIYDDAFGALVACGVLVADDGVDWLSEPDRLGAFLRRYDLTDVAIEAKVWLDQYLPLADVA